MSDSSSAEARGPAAAAADLAEPTAAPTTASGTPGTPGTPGVAGAVGPRRTRRAAGVRRPTSPDAPTPRLTSSSEAPPPPPPPLVVDVDGTLLATDLLWEGLVDILARRPAALLGVLAALPRGRAAVKAAIAERANVDIASLPLRPEVVRLVREARAAGRPVVLASGANSAQVAALAGRVGATQAFGTEQVNLTGEAKLALLRAHFPAFDYVGDHAHDLPLWGAARQAYIVDTTTARTRRRARLTRPADDLVELPPESERDTGDATDVAGVGPAGRLTVWRRALRVQQWSKNLLLVLPAAAAHLRPTGALVLQLLLGWLAFSVTASAVYLANDLADLPHDRRHPTKRRRPLASGALEIRSAVAAIPLLLGAAALLTLALPTAFRLVLLAYVALTSAYSFSLKRRLLLDVMSLVLLYAVRVVAGGLLVGVQLSDWFLAFFSFVFLGLALVKRTDELRRSTIDEDESVAGRAYRPSDLPVLQAFGIAASLASTVIYCLYISSPVSESLYPHQQWLWLGLPVVLYWQARMWVLAARGAIDEDPVAFAAHDRVSFAAAAAMAVLVWMSL